MSHVFFSNKENTSNNNFTNNNEVNNPPKKKSNWSPRKTNSPELEKEIYSVILKPNGVKDNLSEEERSALKNWRKDVILNKKSESVMRSQEMGNRSVKLDKKTDKIKTQQQIAKISFREFNYDPTKEHVKNVEQWSEKWFRKKQISQEWKEHIVNYDAQPGKNSTLYKHHKPDIPVRLLTTRCNAAM